MVATDKEMAEVIRQHQAIKTHMQFLTKTLKKMTAQSYGEKGKPAQLKEQMSLYRWSLYDFRDAIRRHMELDDQVFKAVPSRVPLEEASKEHDEIRKQIDDVVVQTEHAVYNQMDREELNQIANGIREAVKSICESVLTHIAKEDSLLKATLKNPEPA